MKLVFRDGEHDVPDYLGIQMSGLDTAYLTVGEAITKVNERLLRDHVESAIDKIITEHMESLRTGVIR